jgi:hypothetical protein
MNDIAYADNELASFRLQAAIFIGKQFHVKQDNAGVLTELQHQLQHHAQCVAALSGTYQRKDLYNLLAPNNSFY